MAKETYSTIFTSLMGVEMEEVSLAYFLSFLRTGGGYSSLMDTKGGAQEDRIQGGVQQLLEKIVEKYISPKDVFLNEPITKIKQTGNQVLLTSKTGRHFQANHCICTVPLHAQHKISFDPPLPYARQQMSLRTRMGSMTKVIIAYKKPFWRDLGFSGEIISVDGPVSLYLENTQENNQLPSLIGFICGKHSREFRNKPKDRKAAVIAQLLNIFGSQALDFVDYIDKDWAEESYINGCFFSVMSVGVLSKYGHILREPFGLIHFAGTETAKTWMGYYEGAIESGYRVAKEVEQLLPQEPDE